VDSLPQTFEGQRQPQLGPYRVTVGPSMGSDCEALMGQGVGSDLFQHS